MNQNEREGQSAGRTTGDSGTDAEHQQHRTIEGQDSHPGKVWQESDRGDGGLRGGFDQTRTDKGSSDQGSEDRPENEQMDESQWQGSRFSQGGSGNSGGANS